jgi:hypothetical protein
MKCETCETEIPEGRLMVAKVWEGAIHYFCCMLCLKKRESLEA